MDKTHGFACVCCVALVFVRACVCCAVLVFVRVCGHIVDTCLCGYRMFGHGSEAEWEVACVGQKDTDGNLQWPLKKRMYPWGDEPPAPDRCNIDGYRGKLLDVGALPQSDSQFGCRQMMGQVWEWTATAFYPYPGFLPDYPYRENSCPWFGYRKVVKGGCWATSSPIVRAGYRHSFWPNMDAVFTGFRTAKSL